MKKPTKTPSLIWSSEAEADVAAILAYLMERNPRAAQNFLDELDEKAGRLPTHPKLYRPGKVTGTREMLVRVKYVVVYQEVSVGVRIARVLHTSQMWPE